MAVSKRWEGFVLKCYDDNYMPIAQSGKADYAGCWIKLKKDYIPGLGDTADFAIVGATYLPSSIPPPQKSIKKLVWTTFFIGCRESNQNGESRPRFRIVDTVDFNNMPFDILKHLNQYGQFTSCDDIELSPFEYSIDQPQLPSLYTVFKTPFVVEMYGAGFEIPGDVKYHVLRFPRLVKIHQDRSWQDATTFDGLQTIATEAMTVPEDSQFAAELKCWQDKLGCHAEAYCETQRDDIDDQPTRCSPSTPELDFPEISQPPLRRRSTLLQFPDQSKPAQDFPQQLFNVPLLLGSSLLDCRSSSLALFESQTESLTNSISEFLKSVFQAPCDAGVCKGIVLVNPGKQHSLQTTSDIMDVGNAIYTRAARSCHSDVRKDTTPSVGGVVFFLNWLVLSKRDAHRRDISDWRKKVYVGCLKWGALADPQRPNKKRRICDTPNSSDRTSFSPLDEIGPQPSDPSSVSFSFDNWDQLSMLF